MRHQTNSKNIRLVFSALMIAASTILSITSIPLPFGGSITPASMAPLIIVSLLYGFKWGALTCFAYGLIQMLLGINNLTYATTLIAAVVIILFDYLIAFTSLSAASCARNIKNRTVSAITGTLIASVLRFLCHYISGVTVWSEWADITVVPQVFHDTALVSQDLLIYSYSFFYNTSYMLPDTISSCIVAAAAYPLICRLSADYNTA